MIDANKPMVPTKKKTCFCDVIRPFGHQSLCIARAGGGGGGGGFFFSGDPLVLRGKRGGSVVANNGEGKEGGGRVIKNITEP